MYDFFQAKYFFGAVGQGSRVKLIVNMIMGKLDGRERQADIKRDSNKDLEGEKEIERERLRKR